MWVVVGNMLIRNMDGHSSDPPPPHFLNGGMRLTIIAKNEGDDFFCLRKFPSHFTLITH